MEKKIYLNSRGANIVAIYNDETNSVLVLKGSKIREEFVDSIRPEIKDLRTKIINDKNVMDNYVFIKDYEFTSLSAAASVCAGSSMNGRLEFKLENGNSISSILGDVPDFIEYINSNLGKYESSVKFAETERSEFLERYPLEKLRNLKLEEYCKVNDPYTFMNMVEHYTPHVASGCLMSNRNRLFFQRADTREYEVAKVISNDEKNAGKSLQEIYTQYMEDYYKFAKEFDVDTYNSKDFLYGANVIKMNLVLLYNGPVITSMVTLNRIREILDFLAVPYNDEEDSVALNIKLTKYLYEKNPDLKNISLFEISHIIDVYYKKYIVTKSINYYAAGFTIDNIDQKDLFVNKNIFALGWKELGDLNEFTLDEEIISKADSLGLDVTPSHLKRVINDFRNLREGDKIILKSSYTVEKNIGKMNVFALGEVVGNFEDSYKFISGLGHTIPVKWYKVFDTPVVSDYVYRKSLQPIKDSNFIQLIKNSFEVDAKEEKISKIFDGENIIYYGVPGCGKSYLAKDKAESFDSYERILFHPDYTYSDFVGQILPRLNDGKVEYKFIPGPFTKILGKALLNPDKDYVLIIEEINRGNASAIFGDIFQLLDRLKEDKNGYKKGDSEYPIKNEQISEYLNSLDFEDNIEEIYIPNNLSIIATMNSSDQNVFALDTAFKRRWRFNKISNIFDDSHTYREEKIAGTNCSWQHFVETINNKISDLSSYGVNGDDKQIGKYFISKSELTNKRVFAEKVLMYLWEDVVKFDRTLMFKEEYKNLDQLINGFSNYGLDIFKDIFNDETSV